MELSKQQLDNLSKDYSNYTWKYGEPVDKKDLSYLYLELNLSKQEIASFLNISIGKIYHYIKLYKLQKSRKQITELSKRINYEKYGVQFPSQLDEFKQKQEQTCLQRYGTASPLQNEQIKQKTKKTNLQKYGVENILSSSQIREQIKQTCLDKYGCEYYFQTDDFKNKSNETLLNHYGENPFNNDEIKDKRKQTMLQKYGVDNSFKSLKTKQIIKDKQVEISTKKYYTRKSNNTFHVSKPEKYILANLENMFPNRIKTQYKSDDYPFACDFYIIPLDLYIEYQGFWTHGNEPFDKNNTEHLKLIETWTQKSQELNFKNNYKCQYYNAIQIWTKRDPEKRKIAKENNLNWLEFFNLQQFDDWFNNLNI